MGDGDPLNLGNQDVGWDLLAIFYNFGHFFIDHFKGLIFNDITNPLFVDGPFLHRPLQGFDL